MGRPRVKIIDDSQQPSAEVKSQRSKVKTSKISRSAKSESVEAIGEAETTELEARGDSEKESIPSVILEGAQRPIESNKKDAIASLQHDNKETKKPQKPGKTKPRSKKYQEVVKALDRSKLYPLEEAVDIAKKMSYSKINATLEAHINTAQTGIRGLVSLPYAKGVQLRILAFGPSQTPKLPGVVFGSDEAIEEINKGLPAGRQGKFDFDLVITTPEWMPKLAKVARILGPRGLMPNPKNGTIASGEAGLKKAVESFQAGKTEYKTEAKAPVIHIVMGKLDQPTEELSANIKTLLQTLGKTRVKKLTLSPTMGPGVKVDLASL